MARYLSILISRCLHNFVIVFNTSVLLSNLKSQMFTSLAEGYRQRDLVVSILAYHGLYQEDMGSNLGAYSSFFQLIFSQ